MGNTSPEIQIKYGNQDELDASELQNTWTQIMADGKYKQPHSYKKVAVLIIGWAEEHNNLLGIQDEVNRLSAVFRDQFNFPVTSESVRSSIDSSASPQIEVNAIVAQFVRLNDGLNHLLLVYYAGHGKPGEFHGSLIMSGENGQPKSEEQKNHFIWNRTESILRDARANVLEIFDCCHAGDLIFKRSPPRAFEYLAACEAGNFTDPPGPSSFTSALIYALETLLKRKGYFTSIDLVNTIKHEAPHFPEYQTPVLTDRDANSFVGRITLHAMPKSDESLLPPTPAVPDSQLPAQDGKVLTLHFDLASAPTKERIEELGHSFNESHPIRKLDVERIRWGGLRPSSFSQALVAFNGVRRRSRSRPEALDQETLQYKEARQNGALDTPNAVNEDSLISPMRNSFPTPKSSNSSDSEDRGIVAHNVDEQGAVVSQNGRQSPRSNRKRLRA